MGIKSSKYERKCASLPSAACCKPIDVSVDNSMTHRVVLQRNWYRSHFNKAYANLKHDVAALDEQFATLLADDRAGKLHAGAETNTARIEAWKDRPDVNPAVLAADGLLTALKQARESVRHG